jgi:hypothetical protein
VSLKTTSVINVTDKKQVPEITLSAERSRMTYIREEKGSTKSSGNVLTKDATFNINLFLGIAIGPIILGTSYKFKGQTGNSFQNNLEKFLKTGESILVPPHSNTTVSIITTPFRGSIGFASKYQITVPKDEANLMTFEFVKNTLTRLGMMDMKLYEQEGENFVFYKKGFLITDQGVNTHVSISSVEYKAQWTSKCQRETSKAIFNIELFPYGKRQVEVPQPDKTTNTTKIPNEEL